MPHFLALLKPKMFYLWPQSGRFLQLQHTKPQTITANTALAYLLFPQASTSSRPRGWGEAPATTAGWATAQGEPRRALWDRARTKRAFRKR